jgi:all-trans-8'-apo-beta-carotenal 15,15'-oxygenase
MDRRQFVSSCAAGMALGALPLATYGSNSAGGASPAVADAEWGSAFREALQEKPWLGGYRTVSSEAFDSTAQVSGVWPKDLRGTFYRNGPARHEVGDYRYHHWFDGDGMLQSYTLSPQGVTHRARMIQTRKYQAEKSAGRALYPGFASVPPNPSPVTSPDLVNVGNISVLHHHGKLLTLWEAGSPWEMDPETLDTTGLYQFSPETAGVPFSAHPRVEPDGSLWNFGYVSGAGLIVLWHIDANGKLVNIGKVKADPISMPHDFIVTSRHIVLLMPPFNYEPDWPAAFLDAHRWHGDQPTRVLVVDKNDFSKHRWLELPSQWVFHFGNGWEDSSGIIRFDGARGPDPLSMIESFRDVMRGEETPSGPSRHHTYRIDTRDWTISETAMLPDNIQTEFPSVDPRVSCGRYRRLVMLSRDDQQPCVHGNLNEVCTHDLESDQLTRFRYPDSQVPEEHLFVAKPGSAPETKGWVVGTAYDWQRQVTLFNVFDVEALDAGPLATATLPYGLPLGLHGKFVAA